MGFRVPVLTPLTLGTAAGQAASGNDARFIPLGAIFQWPVIAPPAGFLLCDGATPLITDYSALAAVLGTTYGGDGTTTFGLPNLKGRAPVGFDTAQAEFNTIGETGGAKTHTLTAAQMPGHTHTVDNGNGPISSTGFRASGFENSGPGVDTGSFGSGSTGSGGAHNNLPPYIALQFVIKF